MPLGVPMTNFFLYRRGTEASEGGVGPRAHTQGTGPPGSQLRPISMLLCYLVKTLSRVLHLLLSKERREGERGGGREESKQVWG